MRTDASARGLTGALEGAFDFCLGSLSAGVRCDPRAISLDLASVENGLKRLVEALKTHASMGARSLERELARLDYPIARLRDYLDGKSGALDRRGTEIMAEYLELRLEEIRKEAEALDSEAEGGAQPRRCA
ncbi:MAG: hypothetical protein QM765_51960 [Myxococcales bacterium]